VSVTAASTTAQAEVGAAAPTPPAATAATAAPKLLLGLVGAGIQQSLTPAMHEEEARHHGIRLHYQLIDLDHDPRGPAALPTLVHAARTMGFAGFNVTFPCKQQIVPLLDGLSDEARRIGAVNTVVRDGSKLLGHNTDVSGWAHGFRRALPAADLSRVVLLGAGGAGSAIAHALLGLGAEQVIVVDAEAARACELAAAVGAAYPGRGTQVRADTHVARALQGASGLVHATPTGMDKRPGLPLPEALLRPDLWVSEIVYFPLETALLRAARAKGCAVSDGSGMAVGQAADAFRIFTGREPDAARMDAHLRHLLAQRTG
jgi:shikimate dehydrogenase